MAVYRQVHCEFWQDAFVLDLTPEEKYFYVYLMTNSKTTQCGIYELPKRIIETETGYNRETVEKLLQRFTEYGKIRYNEATKEIIILNWIKYNFINSPKVKKCIAKEVAQVKHEPFRNLYITLLERYGYRIDGLSIDLGEEKEKEEEKEEEKEKNNNNLADKIDEKNLGNQNSNEPKDIVGHKQQGPNPFVFFEQNGFGTIGSYIADKITGWINDLSQDLVIEAMKLAVEQGTKKWAYVEAILKSWFNAGLKTLEQVNAATLAHKEQQMKRTAHGGQHPTRQEILPHWFEDNQSQSSEGKNHGETIDFEAEKEKLLERMKKYKSK
ncbi:DnaD domain protein [Cytobacillus sp. IB215316]|uniref:DnaD domain-containing protein n=1 Tax=Cytobacillus sp. IB215316 TaxID=3097354 RepID=UPI002A0FEE7B|nr:DnaD domain protein [Cytobacillus sp. IB215316]MDX8359805.1 DnaD domain protein [Cytobacillus sp. IB215316]